MIIGVFLLTITAIALGALGYHLWLNECEKRSDKRCQQFKQNIMQSKNNSEIKEGLKNLGLFLVFAFTIVFFGTREQTGWLILVCPVLMGLFGYIVGKKSWKSTIGFGVIGLAAGLLWHFFAV